MTRHAFRFALPLVLLGLATACTDAKSPIAPIVTRDLVPVPPAPSPAPPLREAPPFPAVSRPARMFVAEHQPIYSMHGSPLASRYVLYEDGTFALQSASANYPFHEFLGTYKEVDAVISFDWGNTCCSWWAKGVLHGDRLAVEYSDIMQHSDFLNGVYVQTK